MFSYVLYAPSVLNLWVWNHTVWLLRLEQDLTAKLLSSN